MPVYSVGKRSLRVRKSENKRMGGEKGVKRREGGMEQGQRSRQGGKEGRCTAQMRVRLNSGQKSNKQAMKDTL